MTSRRHATVRYENGNYVLRDERSANGTFVNGQQIEEMVPRVLAEGDHVGIGEHELLFRSYGSTSAPSVEEFANYRCKSTRRDDLSHTRRSDGNDGNKQ